MFEAGLTARRRPGAARKMARLAPVLALVGFFFPPGAAGGTKLTGTTLMKGRCPSLIVAGRDLTRSCVGEVTNKEFADRSISFDFDTDRDIGVAFLIRRSDEIGLGQGGLISNVSEVVYTVAGRSSPIKSAGTCGYGNSALGAVRIECRVDTGLGVFESSFLTDGGEPEYKRF